MDVTEENSHKILHVDMDSFFASVEAKRRGVQNEPIVVCVYSGRSEDSGAVSTTSYEAREYGIKAGMTIKRAKQIAKEQSDETGDEFHFFSVDKEYYKQVSSEIREGILEDFSERIEQASIDEYYLDVTARAKSWKEAEELGSRLKGRVKEEFGLTCSVGIGPNKLIAKIASDQNKPDGIKVVSDEDTESFMRSLELEDIHGIGKKTLDKLSSLGISSVSDLAESSVQDLKDEFGDKLGQKLLRKSKGEGDVTVKEREQKQISKITTLKENSNEYVYIKDYMGDLASKLIQRAEAKNFLFKRVVLITIDTELQMRTRSKSLNVPLRDEDILLETGKDLLKGFLKDFDGQIRRVGLRISDLRKSEGQKKLSDFN